LAEPTAASSIFSVRSSPYLLPRSFRSGMLLFNLYPLAGIRGCSCRTVLAGAPRCRRPLLRNALPLCAGANVVNILEFVVSSSIFSALSHRSPRSVVRVPSEQRRRTN
jgi:hypothetical protein